MDQRVDEQFIREQVYAAQVNLELTEDWYTPSGRERDAPIYSGEIHNSYLGQCKTVKGRTPEEVEGKARTQLEKWGEQEIKRRIAGAKEGLRSEARNRTEMAEAEIAEYKSVLEAALDVDSRLDWASLAYRQPFRSFVFDDPPDRNRRQPPPSKPRRTLAEILIPWLWGAPSKKHAKALKLHRQRSSDAERQYVEANEAWHAARDAAKVEYEEDSRLYGMRLAVQHAQIETFRAKFETGDPDAIGEYVEKVYEASKYPEGCVLSCSSKYVPDSATLVVSVALPAQSLIPQTKAFKYIAARAHIEPVPMKPQELDALYDEFIKQTVLRMMYEAFDALYTEHVQAVVVNGWVTSLDKGTGNEKTSCILSVMSTREVFEELNLSRVDASECIRNLKGLLAGPLSLLAPVKPIMDLCRDDSRFVESSEVLAELNATTNLAEIPWEDFEHLVRELFEGIFSGDGTEVRVTQASRDAGVDAIAFDPDPIRGGKFVIQAKRYTRVVGVSAVRDLYGTMINEGASKGILVTTAHFGPDSWEFAKDKPITLIDGANLVHLLEKQGHKVRIDVEAARRASGAV